MVIWYKNSFLASLVSILSCLIGIIGIYGLFDHSEIPIGAAIALIPIAAAGLYLASAISDVKKFRIWRKQVEQKGLDNNIRSSIEDAVTLYNTCPMKKTLEYIRSMNPAAADTIAQRVAANRKK